MDTRRSRLLAVLTQHPDGLSADVLLERAGIEAPARQMGLEMVRKMVAAGEAQVTGKVQKRKMAGAVITPGNRQLNAK